VLKRVSFEAFFNSASPFWYCIWLYVGVFLLACLSWLTWGEPLRRAAFWLLVLALLLQTFGMLGRMYLMQRPLVFVTNLYATAVFIGWMGALAGLGLELVYRKGIGAAVAGLVAFLTAIVGHFLDLAADGDTVGNLQAVLDTNFWLATHVTTVNIGYAAVLVAGCLGIGLILVGLFTSTLDRDLYRMLGQMMYGVLCFATFFSFVGTVTGGIWGDVSWGRFWGWDPKENGALLIVLMCALILHARWGGMIQPRGMAVLAVLGNVVTLWSWFGVNMLGVGLHSYGFMEKGFWWWLAAVLIHLMVALLGLLPLSLWRSYDAVQVDDPGSRYACRFPSPAANTASTETAKPVSSSELAVVPGPHSPKTR
jgi:ABC-type transport system involved in cytochrome c biogenesis permease subunit